jgi:hypothetical protein
MSTTTRDDIVRAAQTLRRAARLLELQAQRVRDERDATHDRALANARGMITRIVTSECAQEPQ